jgi:alpha-1,6-mannosyltransferase
VDLQNKAHEAGLKCVSFLGDRPVSDRARLLAIADVVVVPSQAEPFGLVALEAMASGTPVVAINAGGVSEIVNEETGTLLRTRKPTELASAVLRAISEDWKTSKGATAKRYVQLQHDPSKWVKRLLNIYEDVIAKWRIDSA